MTLFYGGYAMNKKLGIIGALLFVAAVCLGYFVDFPAETIVEVAVGAFGLCCIIIGALKDLKEKGKFSWKSTVVIILAAFGGVLCAIGGFSADVFKTISGLVLALLAVIFGLIFN